MSEVKVISEPVIQAKDGEGNIIASGEPGVDDSPYIQAAIDATPQGGIVDLDGIFKIISPIQIKGVRLRGAAGACLDCSSITSDAMQTGTSGYGAVVSMVSHGSQSITVSSASGLAANDWIKIKDNTAILTYKQAELCQIQSIAGNVLTLVTPLKGTYSAGQAADVRKVSMVSGFALENLDILGPGIETQRKLLNAYLLKDVEIKTCIIRDWGFEALRLTDCKIVSIHDCQFRNIFYTGEGYGIALYNACANVEINANTFTIKGRHYIATGGATGGAIDGGWPRDISVHHNSFSDCDAEAINTHEPFIGPITVADNTFTNCEKGMAVENGNLTSERNTFTDCEIGTYIGGEEQRDTTIRDNIYVGSITSKVFIKTPSVEVRGNIPEPCTIRKLPGLVKFL